MSTHSYTLVHTRTHSETYTISTAAVAPSQHLLPLPSLPPLPPHPPARPTSAATTSNDYRPPNPPRPPVPYLVLHTEPLNILDQRVIGHSRHTDGAGDAVHAGHGREEGGPVRHVAYVYALWK